MSAVPEDLPVFDLPREVLLLRWLTMEDLPALRSALEDPARRGGESAPERIRPEAARADQHEPATDATRFLRFAQRHKLGTFSYWALQRLGLADLLSPRVRTAAKAGALREREVNEQLGAMLRDLRDIFERARADVLFLKGPLFSQRFYGDVDARGVADIDILTRSTDVARIETLLLANGFERAPHLRVGKGLSRLFAHHFEYRRAGLPLDLHWTLQRHYSFRLDEQRMWDTAVTVDCNGYGCPALSDEYELVLQMLGVVTDLQVGKLTLRPVVDIYRILRAVDGHIDWAEFFAWRQRERTGRLSAFVLSLVLTVLDAGDVFPDLRQRLQPLLASLPATALALDAALRSRPTALDHKLLALRLYDTPLAAAVGWWIVSLPFRMAVYGITRQPGFR